MSDGNYKWWYAADAEDENWGGPCDTRDEAVSRGRHKFDTAAFAVCEADREVYDFSGVFSGRSDRELSAEYLTIDDFVTAGIFDRWSMNEPAMSEDGWDDGDFSYTDMQALEVALREAQRVQSGRADAMSQAFEDWAEAHREGFGAVYMFGDVRTHVTVPEVTA